MLDDVDWQRYTILPNTAGCHTAEEAIRIARMARAMELSNWVKLEVIPDPIPAPRSDRHAGSRQNAGRRGLHRPAIHRRRSILANGSKRSAPRPSCRSARRSARVRASSIWKRSRSSSSRRRCRSSSTLASACPSRRGAGDGSRRRRGARQSAIALAEDPALMAEAMAQAVDAGRKAFLAGRIPVKPYASASSPHQNLVWPRSRAGDLRVLPRRRPRPMFAASHRHGPFGACGWRDRRSASLQIRHRPRGVRTRAQDAGGTPATTNALFFINDRSTSRCERRRWSPPWRRRPCARRWRARLEVRTF